MVGTTAGTNVLKSFAAGNFPVRITGVAAIGTLQQTIVGGTYNNTIVGTSAITGGTINNVTLGTATVVGTIVLPATVIPTAALVPNAVSLGSVVFNKAPADGTITGGFADIGGVTGTLAVTVATSLWGDFFIQSFQSSAAGVNESFRFHGTAAAGTFNVPDVNGVGIRQATNNARRGAAASGYVANVAVGTYICTIQGSTAAGSLIVDPNDWLTASALQLFK